MMKTMTFRGVLIYVCACILLLCGGCTATPSKEQNTTSPDSAVDSPANPDLEWEDKDYLLENVINPLLSSGVFRISWNVAEEINPDSLLMFLFDCAQEEQGLSLCISERGDYDEAWKSPLAPADFVEASIQKYFLVSSEAIQKSKYFNQDKGMYRIDGAGEGIVTGEIVGIAYEAETMTVTFNTYKSLELLGTGVVTIVKGLGNEFTYSELTYTPVASELPVAPSIWLKACSDDELLDIFVNPLLPTSVLYDHWQNADEIDVNAFTYFFMSVLNSGRDEDAYLTRLPESDEIHGNTLIPARILEPLVQKYFDVSTSRLRQAEDYHSEKNKYELWGLGSVQSTKLVGTKLNNDILSIEFDLLRDAVFEKRGVLSIRLFENGDFRYLSYENG